jgi:uncharacterized protein YcbK (DUF882 family)
LRIACRRILSGKQARRASAYAAVALCSLFAASSTETAVANGDTRSLDLYHTHTGESIHATFRVNGSYDPAVLEKLNYFLRDWRNNDVTHMDPRLFDVVWETYRTAGASQPIQIVSAYRSPETNAMLRARSHAVAEYSQHILGKAMDTTMPGMSMEQIREIGMRLQRGGVGYYSRENFVHLDVGNVRYWPRMSYEQLARVFPDGKSVDMAADGRTLPRYQEARAEIASRGGIATDVPQTQGGNIFGWLFGSHQQDREEEAVAAREAAPGRGAQVASLDPASTPASAAPAHMSPAERRAARAAAAAAPAVAAIEASQAQGATPASPAAANAARTQVAALAPQTAAAAPDTHAGADPDATAALAKDKDKAGKAIVAALAPLPPPRPAGLIAYADVPTPPSRPAELIRLAALAPQGAADAGTAAKAAPKADTAKTADPTTTDAAKVDAAKSDADKSDAVKSDRAARLALAASLPVVITRGPKDQQGLPASALGYAASASATPATAPRPHATTPGAAANEDAPVIVSARLDRSNYSELTSATPTAEEPPASVLGQAFTGLRQAARIVPDALSATSAGYKIAFNAAAGLLDCAHFTKGAANPPAAPASGVSISEASAAKPN